MSRYRLQPTPAQETVLLEHCGHARFVWNLAVEQQSHYRPGRGRMPGFAERCRQLTEAREEFDWLRAGSVTVQQQALRDFAQAMANFFAGTHKRPTWRKAGQHEGFRQVAVKPHHVVKLNRKWAAVLVPKCGMVKFRLSRPVPDGVKSYRVTRDRSGRWHVAFAATPEPVPAPGNGAATGVDRGVVVSAALSDGGLLNVPGLTAGETRRLDLLQRRLARCKRGSSNRRKVKTAIARLKAREADRRKDWIEQTSTRLAREFDLIGVERLDIRAMTKSAKGTIGQPGGNVRQKAGLNRGILANAWGGLVARLEQKAPGRVIKVPAVFTSQTCSVCGVRDVEARESQARFACRSCNYIGHADVNAARNIENAARTAAGWAVAAWGGDGDARPANHEPQLLLSRGCEWLESPFLQEGEDVKSSSTPTTTTTTSSAASDSTTTGR